MEKLGHKDDGRPKSNYWEDGMDDMDDAGHHAADDSSAFDVALAEANKNSKGDVVETVPMDISHEIMEQYYGKGCKVERIKTGGCKVINDELHAAQRGVFWDMLKGMSNNLMQGKSLVNISLPVKIFESRTFLERITDGWCYMGEFLTLAAGCDSALERMKYTVSGVVAGLHLKGRQEKPFNPILGETLQGIYDDGTTVYMEQSSHHPPVSNYQVIGQDAVFHFWGYCEWRGSYRTNGLDRCEEKGPKHIDFPHVGVRISYNLPYMKVTGMMWGDRCFDWVGTMNFYDEVSGIACELELDADKGGFFSSFIKKKAPTDTMRGCIYQLKEGHKKSNGSKGCKVLSKIEGSWLSHLDFDGKKYWEIKKFTPRTMHPMKDNEVIPSDARFREDLVYLKKGDLEQAQKYKTILEEKQRHDKKLRTDGAKLRKNAGKK